MNITFNINLRTFAEFLVAPDHNSSGIHVDAVCRLHTIPAAFEVNARRLRRCIWLWVTDDADNG